MSFMGAQYVCEGMSITNALRRLQEKSRNKKIQQDKNLELMNMNKNEKLKDNLN